MRALNIYEGESLSKDLGCNYGNCSKEFDKLSDSKNLYAHRDFEYRDQKLSHVGLSDIRYYDIDKIDRN